jgi:hypothetical protein
MKLYLGFHPKSKKPLFSSVERGFTGNEEVNEDLIQVYILTGKTHDLISTERLNSHGIITAHSLLSNE